MNPKLDFRQAEKAFTKTMAKYAEVSSKETADAINHQARKVAISAIKETKKAERAAVQAYLEGPARKGGKMPYPLIKKEGLTRKQIEAKAKRFVRLKLRSLGYIKAGWYKAAQALGARGGKIKPGGLAEKGEGTKARPSKLEATLTNKTVGAVEVSGPALAAAMDRVRKDMMDYLAKKLKKKWGGSGR